MTSKRSLASILVAALIAILAAWFNLNPQDATAPTAGDTHSTAKGDCAPDCPEKDEPVATPSGKGFDHYVLALSWSPSWCLENDPSGKTTQCNRDNDYGFIVHGLWPQQPGEELAYCSTREPDRVPDSLIRAYFDIIPSAGLAGHEWRKHGSCSGLDQKSYFKAMKTAFAAVDIPASLKTGAKRVSLAAADIETMMLKANPALRADGMIVTCEAGRLSEIRICMNKDLSFRSCPEMERRACRTRNINIPPIQ